MPSLEKSLFTYTALFCEENIWKLIESLTNKSQHFNKNYPDIQVTPVDVLFIINASETIAIYEQIKSIDDQPVIWDYHVILTAHIEDQLFVFDFDSRCHFPVTINEYFSKTFPPSMLLSQQFQPLLKAIDYKDYLRYFSSDRSHMRDIIPESQFPKYHIIQASDRARALTLQQCRDTNYMSEKTHLYTPEEYLKARS